MTTKRKAKPHIPKLESPDGMLDYTAREDTSKALADWLAETSPAPEAGFHALDTPQWEPGQPIHFDEHANPVE